MTDHPYLRVVLTINGKIQDAKCSLCHDQITCGDAEPDEVVKARFAEHVRTAHPQYGETK